MQWLFIVLIASSFVFACINGRMDNLCNAALQSCSDGVTLCFTLLGSMGFWSGIMKIAEDSGLSQLLTKLLAKPVCLLFGKLKDREALKLICMNITANLLGLGNAATPLGIAAIKRLDTLNNYAATPSFSMVMLVAVNTASLQLIPTTVAFLRSQYESCSPFSILPASLLTSLCVLTIVVLTVWILVPRKKQLQ